ncbi:hypothetical protein CPB86DRAFT_810097 [Serendipita vermifera]|nr:hypothetical protein CPB86DRAFT_810097 [Serendipita vermifera]
MTHPSIPADASFDSIMDYLIDGMESLQCWRYTGAAAATIYVYDIFLTIDMEVEFIWSSFHFTFPNVLYLLNRYVGLGFFLNIIYGFAGFRPPLSDAYCRKITPAVAFVLSHFCWTAIMALRVSALWSREKLLVCLVWVAWLCTVCIVIATTVVSYIRVIDNIIYNSTIDLCVPTKPLPSIMAIAPISSTTYELILTILTVIKTFRHFSTINGSYGSPLLHVLFRDGVIYFIVSTAIAIVNIFCWKLLSPNRSMVTFFLYWSLVSVFVSRLFVNLRDISRHNPLIGETTANISFNTDYILKRRNNTTMCNTQYRTETEDPDEAFYGPSTATHGGFEDHGAWDTHHKREDGHEMDRLDRDNSSLALTHSSAHG